MGKMSNRDRIAHAAEEARLTEAEKVAKKATKKPSATRSKRSAVPVRMKIVWEICGPNGTPLKAFLYPDKDKAEAETQALSKSTGNRHSLRATKVPME